jgi:hypothetical protein
MQSDKTTNTMSWYHQLRVNHGVLLLQYITAMEIISAMPDSQSTSFEGQIQMIQYDGITIRDISNASAHSDEAQFSNLPSVYVSVDIVTDNKFIHSIKILFLGALIVCSFYANQTARNFLITYSLWGENQFFPLFRLFVFRLLCLGVRG